MDISAALAHFEARLEWEIDAADLWANRDAYIVIDARTPEAFAAGHVPGALSLPHRTIATVDFPKDAVLVTYCDGIGCNASTKAAVKLSRLGYRVKEMIGGIDWWRRDGLPVEGTSAAVACGC
ncbi:MAG TPA: rhodanese-like domain-containing protein [Thermoanaerobaculia bacterium]|nr:rhodanese-like domain-containing protein [Thermoanaerobaculia bacterium]